ncbi:MAG: Gfo/Idh/MocA family oxidoreductase [Firmicutes bacterium]|nr:Gfo/Idh/MocA family oxidoreductase [[Eubacterium] siraeum]MCM1487766.1 Gfo/Idh/MocA family oxidoreductase [Bacillota bacterium]
MNIGILGAGNIARKMAETVSRMENADLYGIASRSFDKAKAFAEEFNIPNCFGSYEELAKDGNVDLVYIATPHSRHYEDCMLCLENRRNVLCEKAFTVNAKQADEVLNYARRRGLFISEAMWTRFMPMRSVLDGIVGSGEIGEISALTANLGYELSHVERLQKPELAGGALLDLGVYTINFALMAFGNNISDIRSSCVKNGYGVDKTNSIIITFADGKTALLHSNAAAATDRLGIIYGTEGRIEFYNINNCEGIKVIPAEGAVTEYKTPAQITGYEYEVEASLKAIGEGKTETPFMPHSETLRVMEIMDSLRKEWGVKYPFE